MKSLFNTVAAVAVATTGATAVSAQDLTIAIVNNGHMINMQKVAEAYTAETGVNLNWVSLEEGVLREQVTSDTATGGGQRHHQHRHARSSDLGCCWLDRAA